MLMKHEPQGAFEVVRDFERAIAGYTGAPRVVAVNSCTMALRLCLDWQRQEIAGALGERALPMVTIPKHTYISVPIQIKRAGFEVWFREHEWHGCYPLDPLPIFDSARWFTSGMFGQRTSTRFVCVSFHATKTLGLMEQGGAILHNAGEACDRWLRAMRHDGRIEGQPVTSETVGILGHHAYMNPSTAALGLLKLASLPEHNGPLPLSDYPDLSTFEMFKNNPSRRVAAGTCRGDVEAEDGELVITATGLKSLGQDRLK